MDEGVRTDRVKLAWLAGLLEGEGSFMISFSRRGDKKYNYARISIQMTDLDVIEKVKDIFQTKIFSHEQQKRPHINSTKTIHRIWLDGNNAVELMKLIYPFMGKRRCSQIDEALMNHKKIEIREYNDNPKKAFANKAFNKKMNEEIVMSVRKDYKDGMKNFTELGKKYGVNRGTIREVVTGRSWRHLPL